MNVITCKPGTGEVHTLRKQPGVVDVTWDGRRWSVRYATTFQAQAARRVLVRRRTATVYDATDLIRNAETRWGQYCGEPVARVVEAVECTPAGWMPDPQPRPLPFVAVRGTVTRWTPRLVRGKRWMIEEAA